MSLMFLKAKYVRYFQSIISLLMLMFFFGCTRPSEDKTKLSFSLPKSQQLNSTSSNKVKSNKIGDVSAQSASLMHLVVNITGPGMPGPFLFEWDMDSPNPNCDPVTSVCTVDIIAGPDRMVQVLAVYEDSTGSVGFYYDDPVKSLVAGNDKVDVYLKPILSTTSITMIQLSGRYLSSANSGPTGKMEVRYTPPGKPSMIITTTEIFNGWFSVFGIIGVPFQYFVNGMQILPEASDLALLRSKLGNNLLEMNWPSYYRDKNGTVSSTPEDASKEFVGFFGPGLSGAEKVCYGTTAGQITDVYKDISKTPLDYNVTTTSDLTKVFVYGGGMSAANCTTADQATGLAINYDPVTEKRPIELMAPFARLSSGNLIDLAADTATWDYLPGANAQIGFVKLFLINSTIMDSFRMPMAGNMMRCLDIDRRAAAGDVDIKLAGVVPATQKQLAIPLELKGLITNPSAVLCPVLQNGMMMNSVARTWGGGPGNCTSCGPSVVADDFRVNYFNTIGVNQCHRLYVRLGHNTGSYFQDYNVTNSQSWSFTFITGAGDLYLYNLEGDCNNNANPISSGQSFSIASSETQKLMYVRKMSTGASVSFDINATAPSTISKNLSLNVNTPSASVASASLVFSNSDIKMGMNDCREVNLMSYDSVGVPYGDSSGWSIPLQVQNLDGSTAASSGYSFYDSCALNATAISQVTFAPNKFFATFAIKSSSAPSYDKKVNLYSVGKINQNIYLGSQALADHMDATPTIANIYEGDCVQVNATPKDINNNSLSAGNVTHDIPFGFHFYNLNIGTYYSDVNCSIAGQPPQNLPFLLAQATTSFPFFIRANQSGVNIQADIQSPYISTVKTQYFNFISVPHAWDGTSVRLKSQLVSDQIAYSSAALNNWNSTRIRGDVPWEITSCGSNCPTVTANPAFDGVQFGPSNTVNFSTISAPYLGDSSPSGDFTVVVRFKMNSLGSAQQIFSLQGTSSDNFYFGLDSGDNMTANHGLVSTSPTAFSGSGTLPLINDTTNWYDMVIVSSAGAPRGYQVYLANALSPIPGAPQFTFSYANTFSSMSLGDSSQGFNGAIKAVMIYNRALSSTEAQGVHTYLNTRFP